jgi:hypothetical protein
MITYKFPQFKVEIVNPTVTVAMRTLRDNAVDNLLSADVLLETDTAKFGVTLENMTYVDNWYNEDVLPMCMEKLKEYEKIN